MGVNNCTLPKSPAHCRYTVWRKKALARRKRRGPLRIVLGSLLPIAVGFAVAKTGFGSRSTAHAVDDVTNSFTGAVQKLKNKAVHGHVHHEHEEEPAAEAGVVAEQPEHRLQPTQASRNRSFFGIL